MSDVKRWLAVPGPGSYVRLMPVSDEASGVDIFAKSNELHALAARLATKQADLDRALLALTEAQELNSQWRLDWKASQASLATANERLREADEIVRDLLECGCGDHREIARKWRVSYGAWLAGSAPEGQS